MLKLFEMLRDFLNKPYISPPEEPIEPTVNVAPPRKPKTKTKAKAKAKPRSGLKAVK